MMESYSNLNRMAETLVYPTIWCTIYISHDE